MPDFVSKLVAKVKDHKLVIAGLVAVAAGLDHFFGSAIISSTLADLLNSAP
jgi:hypothetical protein